MPGAASRGIAKQRREPAAGSPRASLLPLPAIGIAARGVPSRRPPSTELERLPVGVFQTDADGNCEYVNGRWCEYAGITAKAALGRGWVTAIHPEDRATVLAAWNDAVADGSELHLEFRSLRPDGSVAWLSGSAVSLERPDGSIQGWV